MQLFFQHSFCKMYSAGCLVLHMSLKFFKDAQETFKYALFKHLREKGVSFSFIINDTPKGNWEFVLFEEMTRISLPIRDTNQRKVKAHAYKDKTVFSS